MPNLAPHLHTDECNKLIQEMFECDRLHPYKKFLGACNLHYVKVQRCLKMEREQKRKTNHEKARERMKQVRGSSKTAQ